MPYVQRKDSGDIVGIFANFQPYADEWLPDDDVEVVAYLNPLITLDDVKAECGRRIYAACSAAAQANINGYINLLNATALGGTALTESQQADIMLFGRAMEWINEMRGGCAALVADPAFADDASWPPLPDDIAAFARRF